MGFEATWLADRGPYDEAALDRAAVSQIQAWAGQLPASHVPIVVDLGSGTGAALRRARCWLADRPVRAYAVDRDAALLTQAREFVASEQVLPIVGDLLEPLCASGGPADGTVDLVLGHALADLVPLDRLADRAARLLRPGGLVHLALAYDGLTAFSPAIDAALDRATIAAFHRHMDGSAARQPTYGGSTAGRRVAPALVSAGLTVLVDAPSVWQVRADDGEGGRRVLARLIRFVVEAAREVGSVSASDLDFWERERLDALAARTLAVTVGHRDVLAARR